MRNRDVVNKLKKLLDNNLSFHDSSIGNIDFNFADYSLRIRITNYKITNDTENKQYIIVLRFFDISQYQVNFTLNEKDDSVYFSEIANISYVVTEQDALRFIITGIKGWKILFDATHFEYEERIMG